MNPLVLLLVGGRSTRFWPLGEKPLMKFCGKPLFLHQLDLLKAAGLKEVLVIGQAENLPELKKLTLPKGMKINFAEQTTLVGGMASALLDTAKHWNGKEILVASGDDVIEPAGLKKLLKFCANEKVAGALLAQKVSEYFPGGYLETDGQNRVSGIVEKPERGKEPSDLVNLVFHYHRDSQLLYETLLQVGHTKDDQYEGALAKLFAGKNYFAVPYSGFWQGVKYPWQALRATQFYLSQVKNHRGKNVSIAKTATIKGNVYLGDNVKVFEGATIAGPAYIGTNSIIGNNALVRESSLGEGCLVGYNTEVARSVWQDRGRTHMNYVGDSLWAENVSFGAGAITANLRLDESEISSEIKGEKTLTGLNKFGTVCGGGVRVGVNTTLLPGVKIGAGTFVASQMLVESDIAEHKFYYQKDGRNTLKDNRA